MNKNKKNLRRLAAKARRKDRIPKRPGFAPQDLPDAIEAKMNEGLLHNGLDEDEAYAMILDNHPDLKEMQQSGALPEEFIDENGTRWNPRLHLAMHAVVERQLAVDEPKGVVELAIRFEREKKLCAHEIKHVIAAALAEQIWAMQHEKVGFDEKQYFIGIEDAYQRRCNAVENGVSDDDE
jgi:Domain of unknown function (DUF1841)